MRGSLTSRQNEVYEYIRDCIQRQSTPPTITEIMNRFGLRSTNGVNDLLNALERKEYIVRMRGTARGIALTDVAAPSAAVTKGSRKIPIVGEGDADAPISIFMNPQGVLVPDPLLFPAPGTFAAIVADDGMDGEAILKGDHVIVRQDQGLEEETLVFALVGTQQLVRRLRKGPGGTVLVATNRHYRKIPVTDSGVAIVGEVIGVIRKL
jgi:repressor LexA